MDLIFSTAGAIIFASVAVIVVAITLVILRNHSIDIGAKGYIFKFGSNMPELQPATLQLTQVSAKPDNPIVDDEDVANQKGALVQTNDDFTAWLERLRKAKKDRDSGAIEECFDTKYKNRFIAHDDYEWEVWKHTELLRAGFIESIRELERLERENATLTYASRALSRYYIGIGATEKASPHVEMAITRATTDSDRVSAFLLKAELIQRTKGKVEARELIYSCIELIADPEQKAVLFFKLGEMYESDKSLFDAIVAFEQATKYDPHNKSARFRSAYLCASIDGLQILGLRQYRILRNQDEEYGSTVNNLGILYGELGHEISKINLFKIAAEQNEAWGYGNLIIAFLEAGFMEEAEKLIISVPDSIRREDRFVYAQSIFNDRKNTEDEAIKILIENAEVVYQNVHEFLVNVDITSEIFGSWTSTPAGYELSVEKSGEFIKVEQIDPVYRRWGITSDLQHLSVFSVQQERREKSGQSLLALAMDSPSPAGHFILCRAGDKIRLFHVKDQKLSQRIEFTKKHGPVPIQKTIT